MNYVDLIKMVLDLIYGFDATEIKINEIEYMIEIGASIPDWGGVSGEMRICFLAEAKKFGISVEDQVEVIDSLAPELKVIEGWGEAIVNKCPTLSHPWASKQIGANLATRLYIKKDLWEEDFFGAVYNHKKCIIGDGILLKPLNLKTGFIFVDSQGQIGPAPCDKWNIGLEKLGNMPEAVVISEVWKQKEAEVIEACSKFCKRLYSK